jgi:TorA maturation chaperone TorD
VADDLIALAVLHNGELEAALLGRLRSVGFPASLQLKLQSEPGHQALAMMRQGLEQIPVEPEQRTLDELAADYAAIYLNNTHRASPSESVWVDEEGLAMQEPMFQVREIYARYGLVAQDWRRRPDDHLVHQLQFLSHLVEHQRGKDSLLEAARFLDEHLLRWLEPFAVRVAGRCGTLFYAGLALLTATYVDELREHLVRVLDAPRPSAAEIEERMRPKRIDSEQEVVAYVPGASPSW